MGRPILIGAALASGFIGAQAHTYFENCGEGLTQLPDPTYEAVPRNVGYICDSKHPNCGPDNFLAALYSGGNSEPRPLESMDQGLRWTLRAAEDRYLGQYNHIEYQDVGYRILGRGLINSARTGEINFESGGSNIIMQYFRNNWIQQSYSLRDDCRKILEISGSNLLLEQLAGEPTRDANGNIYYPGVEAIEEDFMNKVPMGRGAYGVEMGSRAWFGKSSSDLTIVEEATLWATIKGPSEREGSKDPERNARQMSLLFERRDEILKDVVETGYYTQEQVDAALAAQPDLSYILPYNGPVTQGPANDIQPAARIGAEHFVFDVLEEIEEAGIPINVIRQGGRVNTTFDIRFQEAVHNAVNANNPNDGVREFAVVAMAEDGAILAEYSGDWGKSEVVLAEEHGPVGSALKPATLANALQQGHIGSVEDICVEEVPFVWSGAGINGSDYPVEEGDHLPNNQGTYREALARSSNMCFLQLHRDHPGALESTAQALDNLHAESPTPPYPSLTLGWRESSTMDLAHISKTIAATGGVAQKEYDIVNVTQLQGGEFVPIDNGIFGPFEPNRVFSQNVAYQVRQGMLEAVDYGTADDVLAGVPTALACKTGSVPNGAGGYIHCAAALPYGDVALAVGQRNVDDGNRNLGADTNGAGYPARIVRSILEPLIDQSRNLS